MSERVVIKHFAFNAEGQDWAVGDIHGHFTLLQAALDAIGFNPAVDRLFSVGDLVDRGPESELALEWLDKPWFHAVEGNHEELAIVHAGLQPGASILLDQYMASGGAWLIGRPALEQKDFAFAFSQLPLVMEVETRHGLVGIVHADCPLPMWTQLKNYLLQPKTVSMVRMTISIEDNCKWSRSRIELEDDNGICDLRALIVGHTPLRQVAVLGNVFHIDTRGWLPHKGGFFTLLNLNTLEAVPPIPPKLQWDENG